jgi:hypothetical protein
LPEVLLVPFSRRLHKARNLFVITPTYFQYSLQMSVHVEPLCRYINDFQYTGCNRRKGPNFGRVFLM